MTAAGVAGGPGPLASIPSPSSGVWHLGPLPVRAYALCILAGVVAAVVIADRRWRARGGQPGFVADLATVAVPAGIVGARIYHVITSPDAYFGSGGHPLDAFAVWRGGLGIWGGIAGGVAAGAWWCRRHGVSALALMDAAAPGLAVAQAIGRLGNWFNQELYGRPTDLPWGLEIDPAHRPPATPGRATYQPTFLYELLWDLGVAALVVLAGRRWRLDRGRSFALYVAAYTVGRTWIEALRVDPAHRFLGLRLNDYVSVVVLVGAVAYIVVRSRTASPAPAADERPTLEA